MVAQQLSEQQSHKPEVNLFCLNGFESYYKFTQKKKLFTYAVSGVTSNMTHSPFIQLSLHHWWNFRPVNFVLNRNEKAFKIA